MYYTWSSAGCSCAPQKLKDLEGNAQAGDIDALGGTPCELQRKHVNSTGAGGASEGVAGGGGSAPSDPMGEAVRDGVASSADSDAGVLGCSGALAGRTGDGARSGAPFASSARASAAATGASARCTAGERVLHSGDLRRERGRLVQAADEAAEQKLDERADERVHVVRGHVREHAHAARELAAQHLASHDEREPGEVVVLHRQVERARERGVLVALLVLVVLRLHH
jgi:hypothetical protein